MLGADRADLRNCDLEIREHFQEKRLEFHVRAIDLVNQQHGRRPTVGLDGLEQRAPDQILLGEDLSFNGFLITVLNLF